MQGVKGSQLGLEVHDVLRGELAGWLAGLTGGPGQVEGGGSEGHQGPSLDGWRWPLKSRHPCRSRRWPLEALHLCRGRRWSLEPLHPCRGRRWPLEALHIRSRRRPLEPLHTCRSWRWLETLHLCRGLLSRL